MECSHLRSISSLLNWIVYVCLCHLILSHLLDPTHKDTLTMHIKGQNSDMELQLTKWWKQSLSGIAREEIFIRFQCPCWNQHVKCTSVIMPQTCWRFCWRPVDEMPLHMRGMEARGMRRISAARGWITRCRSVPGSDQTTRQISPLESCVIAAPPHTHSPHTFFQHWKCEHFANCMDVTDTKQPIWADYHQWGCEMGEGKFRHGSG